MVVTVHRVLTGAAAQAGAVRINCHGEAVILLATGLTVEAEAELLGELIAPEDVLSLAVVPQPREPATDTPELAAG